MVKKPNLGSGPALRTFQTWVHMYNLSYEIHTGDDGRECAVERILLFDVFYVDKCNLK